MSLNYARQWGSALRRSPRTKPLAKGGRRRRRIMFPTRAARGPRKGRGRAMTEALKVRTDVKGGGIAINHSQAAGLKVRTQVKGGRVTANHSEAGVRSIR